MVWIAWDNTFKDGLHSLGHYILLSTLVQGKLLYYQQIVQDIYNTFKDSPDGLELVFCLARPEAVSWPKPGPSFRLCQPLARPGV